MRVPFRQGIVYAPANFVTLSGNAVSITLAGGESIAIHFADGNANYLITESRTVHDAWYGPFSRGIDYWLYWDINPITGEKTYGHTTIEPIEGPTAPNNPQHGQHWFDTSKGSMFEWQGVAGRWIRKIRVFATALYDGNVFISTSINSPSYIGTQVGDNSSNVAGALVYDGSGSVIKKGDGTFFTTEDVVTTGLGSSVRVKIENTILQAHAASPIPRYSVVRFIDFDQVVPARNMLKDPGVYGLVEVDAATGDIVNVVTEGVFTTVDWDTPVINGKVNDLVYVDSTGSLTLEPQPSHIVGVIVGRNTVLLNNMTVDSIGLIESAITLTGPAAGVVVSGTTGTKSSSFNISLQDDLLAVESIDTLGIVRRDGVGAWSAGRVELTSDTSGVLAVSQGGTGNSELTGYVVGDGLTVSAIERIPGGDIDGDIAGRADNVTGIVSIDHGGTGSNNRREAINALLPPQLANGVLVSNGVDVSWEPAARGSVTSIEINSLTPNLVVTGGPITTSGSITLSLQGTLKALDEINTAGWLARNESGDVIAHSISSPSGSLNITNGSGSSYGGIYFDLPVVNLAGTYVDVDVDVYGRVVDGRVKLDWAKIDTTTVPNTVGGLGLIDVYTKGEIDASVWNWSTITSTPTTIQGYGISDAYTKAETEALYWDWSRVLSTPSTIDGYGITDAIKNGGGVDSVAIGAAINRPAAGGAGRLFVDTTSNTLSYDNGNQWINVGNGGTVTYVDVVSNNSDLIVSGGPVTAGGTLELSLTGELGAVSHLTDTGFVVRQGSGMWTTTAVLGVAGDVKVINGDGIGNVTIGLEDVGTPNTYYSVTTDTKGRVLSGTTSPELDWHNVSGTPTTLEGYGITDAVTTSRLGANNGVATLDSFGKIPVTQLPALAITNTFVISSQADMLALVAQPGDVAIRTDLQKSYILVSSEPSFISSWQELLAGDGGNDSGVSYINAVSQNPNLTISGGPIIDTGELVFGLAGNLAGAAALNGNGLVRVNNGVWTTGNVNLDTDTSGFLSVGKGGTGTTTLTGYVVGNGGGAMTATTTIPGEHISGDIAGRSDNITGIVNIVNGGTGANTRTGALDALLPPQVGSGVLYTNGVTPSWSNSIPGSFISGPVSTATNALSLGGYPAEQFVPADGTNASGTWDINITGDAASVGGVTAASLVRSDGTNASGTWDINITGDAVNVTGTVGVANGGTGSVTVAGAVATLLAPQTAMAGWVLSSNGVGVEWVDVSNVMPPSYTTIVANEIPVPQRSKLRFDPAFTVFDDTANLQTDIGLAPVLVEFVDGLWVGNNNLTTVGTVTSGTWNATTIGIAYGGTGATTRAGAANNILPVQTGNSGKVLSTDGSNASWTTPTVAFTNVSGKPTTLAGYGITDAVPLSHTTDGSLHLTAAQNLWLDAITVTSTEVNHLTGVTSNIQTQLNAKETTTNKGVANGYASLNSGGKVPYAQLNGPVSSSQTIASGAYYEYDTWTEFGNGYDAKTLMISVKVLDNDNTSATYNMHINSEAVATVAVKDSRYVRVYNEHTASLTFHISVRP